MRLINLKKVENGLLEHNNYFLKTPIGDMLGDFRCSRSNGIFTLHYGRVERPFNYEEFVVIVKKIPNTLIENQQLKFYTRTKDKVYGLLEEENVEDATNSSEWKLVRHDGFTQGYMKNLENQWLNMGGGVSEPPEYQGFAMEGQAEFAMLDYAVYSSPYISIFDVPYGYSAEVFNLEGETIFERRYADETGEIELYVTDIQRGRLVIYDIDGNPTLEVEDEMYYGDKYVVVDHDIELRYKGRVLDHIPTKLTQRRELVYVVNTSDTRTYERILVVVNNENKDSITISLDNVVFDNQVYIPVLRPNHSKDIYIRIERNTDEKGYFNMRKFALEIDEY